MTLDTVEARLQQHLERSIYHSLLYSSLTAPLWLLILTFIDRQRRRHQARQRELITVFEAIDEALIAVDSRGHILEVNPVALTLVSTR